MQMNRKVINVTIICIFFGFLSFAAPLYSEAETVSVTIPGDVSRMCYYTNYFYNFPSEDYVYYLNDRMLFWEKPDGLIIKNGVRDKLLQVVRWHQLVKSFLRTNSKGKADNISLDMATEQGYLKAQELVNLMGRQLRKNKKGQYYITRKPEMGIADYFRFALIRSHVMERQLNQTHRFNFRIKEATVPIPWDFKFLGRITGLPLDESSFFEHLLKNEQFSLLIATLYRLSMHETSYIDKLGGWEKIYNDKKLLMGMFVLSHAFRVKDGKLVLPGGDAATDFWTTLASAPDQNVKPGSFDFIRQLATKDEGKLNYLYVFSYFMKDDARKAVLFQYDASKFREVYALIPMRGKEKLNEKGYPVLDDWNFFTLLYSLRVKDGKVDFPQGIDTWIKAVNGGDEPGDSTGKSGKLGKLFSLLLQKSSNGKPMNANRIFMAIYSKFYDNPELLGNGTLAKLYSNYKEYNGIVDFVEKLPLKNPGTVDKLFNLARKIEDLSKGDRVLYTLVYQGLFEVLSFTAKYAPDAYDYDMLVSELAKIPLTERAFYPGVFAFMEKHFKIREGRRNLKDVMLTGVKNHNVTLNNAGYRFMIRNSFKKSMKEVLDGQGICTMDNLMAANRLLKEGLTAKPEAAAAVCEDLRESFLQLPYPGISDDAPRNIRKRVQPYSRSKLLKLVDKLTKAIHKRSPKSDLRELINEIQGAYLVYQLRDHLLGLTYAVSAKNPRLKAFVNPNYVRLHDINNTTGHTLWDNYGKPKKPKMLTKYHLSGGLSRLGIVFTYSWKEHLFRENVIHNSPHVQALVLNLLELYPLPKIKKGLNYHGLLVELGLDALRESKEYPQLKADLMDAVRERVAGYHYHRVAAYLDNKSDHNNLFFSEIKQLGEVLLNRFSDRPYLQGLDSFKKLGAYKKQETAAQLENEMDQFGSCFPHTFGNLKPRKIHLFPQDVGSLMGSHWLGGAMIDEFKIKLAYHMYKKQTPPSLLGQILYMYLNKTGKQFLRQNHIKDFSITYFVFDIFNTSHLKRLIKKLQKEGQLQLK